MHEKTNMVPIIFLLILHVLCSRIPVFLHILAAMTAVVSTIFKIQYSGTLRHSGQYVFLAFTTMIYVQRSSSDKAYIFPS